MDQQLDLRRGYCQGALFMPVAMNCVNLHTLLLGGCKGIDEPCTLAIAQHLFELRELDLGGCVGVTDEFCRFLARLRHLEVVNLSGSFVTEGNKRYSVGYLTDPALKKLANSVSPIRELNLSHQPFLSNYTVTTLQQRAFALESLNFFCIPEDKPQLLPGADLENRPSGTCLPLRVTLEALQPLVQQARAQFASFAAAPLDGK